MDKDIIKTIESGYFIKVLDVLPIRQVIGSVYKLITDQGHFVVKHYRHDTSIEVVKSIDVMDYLYRQNGPVPKIIKTKDQKNCLDTNQGKLVLFESIHGHNENNKPSQSLVIDLYRHLQSLMKDYTGALPQKGKAFYLDRFIDLLKSINFPHRKISELEEIGQCFYAELEDIDRGFVHGDYHSGNMIVDQNQRLVLLDFDACNHFVPWTDLVVYFDQTNFNRLRHSDIQDTIKIYEGINELSSMPLKQVLAFIPIRHYEIIATIIEAKGMSDVSLGFFDEQYKWLTTFYDFWHQC